MSGLEEMVLPAILAVIQALGLISAALTRLCEGSNYQAASQRLFLCCLGLVGLTTMIGLGVGPGSWLTSGATLSLMVLGTTCDFRRADREAAGWPISPPTPRR